MLLLSRPSDEAFDNIYYKKACDDWKAKLIAGEFTEKNKKDQRVEAEKDRAKVDPWKVTVSSITVNVLFH